MDVFADQLPVLAPLLRRAAETAAARLGTTPPANHRYRAMTRVLALPEAPVSSAPLGDWDRLAEVILNDRPLRRPTSYHSYLDDAGARAAAALWAAHAATGSAPSLLDIGGGIGTYAAAFLRAHRGATATLVEIPEVAQRVPETAGLKVLGTPFSTSLVTGCADVVLLANLLHMHGPTVAEELLSAAARRVAPGGRLLIKDFDPETEVGACFDLSLALYLEEGRLHPPATLCYWLARCGMTASRHALGPAFVLVAHASPSGPDQTEARPAPSK
jgi:SAM-dependent methyltransferase